MGPHRPRVRRDRDIVPRGKSRRALSQQSAKMGWDFHVAWGGIDPDHCFRPPRVVGELQTYGRIYDPGMGP